MFSFSGGIRLCCKDRPGCSATVKLLIGPVSSKYRKYGAAEVVVSCTLAPPDPSFLAVSVNLLTFILVSSMRCSDLIIKVFNSCDINVELEFSINWCWLLCPGSTSHACWICLAMLSRKMCSNPSAQQTPLQERMMHQQSKKSSSQEKHIHKETPIINWY